MAILNMATVWRVAAITPRLVLRMKPDKGLEITHRGVARNRPAEGQLVGNLLARSRLN